MTSDRARVTYDPSRQYHGVVAQQGRVSLEADWNEAQTISGAQLAARTLDFVGPAGSPDRGYHISADVNDEGVATGDLLAAPGALYVGGQRISLAHELRYGDQPEWTDHEGDPLWHDPAIPTQPHELVYLLAREQEVGAVEDPVLRDVALGGPDTARRLRIVQRLIRYPTAARTWEEAWGQLIEEQWKPAGFRLRHDARFLEPTARIQVTGHGVDGGEQPADQGGYVGANNQLVRVQIARIGDNGVPVLVWGYDNASFLYRLSSAVAGPVQATTVQLATPPVDDYHQPREDQAVEVLRSAAYLTGDDYVAASTGQVAKVAKAYDPDSREVVIGTELPPEYLKKPGEVLPLYLRVWEGEFPCEPGEEHELGRTGIRVRLTAPEHDRGGKYSVGAYWMIAIRPGIGPGTQAVVYPQRILDGPQPPDGPRQWLTPIAFVRWHPVTKETQDCVARFGGLVREERSSGSCTIQIRPHDVGGGWGLQDAIDAHTNRDHPATICLEPGTYVLSRPLRIGPEHGRLTIRAARPGVVLRAEPEAAPRFLRGMIMVADSAGFSLEGVEIHPAHTRFALDRGAYQALPDRARLVLDRHRHRAISIGLHVARCRGLAVKDCRFIFSVQEPRDPDDAARDHTDLFGVAIFGAEELRGVRVTRCTFAAREEISHARRRPRTGEAADDRHHVTIGFMQVPTAMAVPPPGPSREADREPRGSASVPLLDDAVFDGNRFERLTAPLVAIAQLGAVRLEGNTAQDCHAGFWLVTQYASHVLTLLDRLVNQIADAFRQLVDAFLTALAEPLLFYATVLARALPDQPPDDQQAAAEPSHLEPPSTTDDRQASELLHQLSSATAAEEASSASARKETRARRFLDTFGRASRTRARPAQVAVPPQTSLRCCLTIAGNVLESRDAPGLVVLNTGQDSDASLVLAGNQFRGRPWPGAVACLYLLRSCAAAANVIVHVAPEEEPDASIVVLAQRHHGRHQTAITGNVLVGRAILPHRPDDFPSWETLNSVTQ